MSDIEHKKKIIIANWKMNPSSADEAVTLFELEKEAAKEHPSVTTIICPPVVYLSALNANDASVALGAQNLFWEKDGAYTGEISGTMLRGLGVEYVIVGHSERRAHLKETDEMIGKKISAALASNIVPIFCVGETLEEKNSGDKFNVLERQMRGGLEGISHFSSGTIIVAYEPRWAIGTGVPETPEQTVEVIQFLKKIVSEYSEFHFSFVYGGSLDEINAELFLREKDVEGALVGGASLDKDRFSSVLKVASDI